MHQRRGKSSPERRARIAAERSRREMEAAQYRERCTLRRRESEHSAAKLAARHSRPQHEQEGRTAARPGMAARSTWSCTTHAIAGSDATATEFDVDTMTTECPYCHALMWPDENRHASHQNVPSVVRKAECSCCLHPKHHESPSEITCDRTTVGLRMCCCHSQQALGFRGVFTTESVH